MSHASATPAARGQWLAAPDAWHRCQTCERTRCVTGVERPCPGCPAGQTLDRCAWAVRCVGTCAATNADMYRGRAAMGGGEREREGVSGDRGRWGWKRIKGLSLHGKMKIGGGRCNRIYTYRRWPKRSRCFRPKGLTGGLSLLRQRTNAEKGRLIRRASNGKGKDFRSCRRWNGVRTKSHQRLSAITSPYALYREGIALDQLPSRHVS